MSALPEASGFSLSPPPAYPNGSEASIATFNGGGGGQGVAHYSLTDNPHTSLAGAWENVLWTRTPKPRGSSPVTRGRR